MERQIDTIWDYIDGNLNQEQLKSVKARLETDPAFKALYDSQLKLNLSLIHI